MEPLGYIPPAEAEANYYPQLETSAVDAHYANQPPRFPWPVHFKL
ncbi:putative membrane protein [Caballeronia sordidicola]|uniref:Putative membrane protein n=1 Tax=Caballeronia sordidicola TaxID=196367 RepID=A0A226WX88_CABSO|nr:putative membrane protein [Caballeronia sordidicola]